MYNIHNIGENTQDIQVLPTISSEVAFPGIIFSLYYSSLKSLES